MREVYLLAAREIREKARSRGFLLTTIALPLILIIIGLVTEGFGGGPPEDLELPTGGEEVIQSLAYVDRADLIGSVPEELSSAQVQKYESLQAARAAAQRGEITAFYLIHADYRETGRVTRFSKGLEANAPDTEWLEWLLLSNLLPDMDREERMRARYPFHAQGLRSVTLSDTGAEGASSDSIIPYFVGLIIMMPLFTSGGYLFQSLQQEKSSRMLEILLASIRPWQLLAGKVLGYGALILLQYLVWGAIAGAAGVVAGSQIIGLLASVDLAASELAWILPYALGGFLLYAGIMSGIGALAEDMESSRVWVFLVTLPMLLPFYLGSTISQAPAGPLAVVLSLIPFSAPVAMMLRLTSTTVPLWEILVSIALLFLTGAGAVAIMARIFRAQVLLSGGGLSPGRFWRAVTQSS
jgi:ABC-2 type transport system permease protein